MAKKTPVYVARASIRPVRGIRLRTIRTAHSVTNIPRDGIVVRMTEEEFLRTLVVDGHRFEQRKLSS